MATPPDAGDQLGDDMVDAASAPETDQASRPGSSPDMPAIGFVAAPPAGAAAGMSEEVSALLGRARFLGELLAAWMIDSIWLIAVSAWVLLVGKLAGKFEDLHGMEKAFVDYAHIALAGGTFFLVTYWAIIDLIGSTKRIWGRRR